MPPETHVEPGLTGFVASRSPGTGQAAEPAPVGPSEQERETPESSGKRARWLPTELVVQNAVPRGRGPQCQAETKAGAPCTANATARSNYARCPYHDEQIPEETKALWRAKGHAAIAGAMTVPDAPDPALATPEAITRFIEETAGRVLRGEISATTGTTLTGLAGAALRAYEANLGQKLADLEAIVIERGLRGSAVRVLPPLAQIPAATEDTDG